MTSTATSPPSPTARVGEFDGDDPDRQRVLLGPVRSGPDPFVAAAVGLVSLDGTPVREDTVEVAVGAARGWAPYVFASPAEAPPSPADDLLTSTVHVDEDARLR